MSIDNAHSAESRTSVLDRERAFHNNRFENGDGRETQLKYYWAIQEGAEAYHARIGELARGADVLDYGCSIGLTSGTIKDRCHSLVGIDISEVAIDVARSTVGCDGIASFSVMDAMDMSFPDRSFDLVFGSGILHHLDTARSLSELARVIRPGGRVLLWEPLGLNPLINIYRYFTPSARTPDEHPLLPSDFAIMRRTFSSVDVKYYGLTTIAAVPLRGVVRSEMIRRALQRVDNIAAHIPYIQFLCWYSLIECKK
jgi:SAM-dependent methyltransferase